LRQEVDGISTKRILISIAIVVGIIIVAIAVGFGLLASRCVGEVNEAKAVVGEFMVAGQAYNIEWAYALCAPQVNRSEVEGLIADRYDDLFQNYWSLRTSSWHIEVSGGMTTASLEGSVVYTDDSLLPYDAELVKTGGEWKIYYIYIGY
jgi:hypothetical protein